MDTIVEPGSFFRHFFYYESKVLIEAMVELNDIKKWNQITSKICPLKTLLVQKRPKKVRNIEVSAITKHRSAVLAILSAKLKFSAKTVCMPLIHSFHPDYFVL